MITENDPYNQFIKTTFTLDTPLSEESLAALQAIAQVETFPKNSFLLPVGKTARKVHLLYQGAIIAYFLDHDGNTYNKNIFLEGDFVGSTVSYLTNSPSKFALEAIEDCTVISFDYQAYRKLIETHADLKDFYIAYLERNWVISKEKREIALVMESAGSRYLQLLKEHPGIDERIPLRHIASHLGITPTQLSRIRKEFK